MKDPQDRHDNEYKVRLTEAQADAIEGLAAILDIPPAVYLRHLIVQRLREIDTHQQDSTSIKLDNQSGRP